MDTDTVHVNQPFKNLEFNCQGLTAALESVGREGERLPEILNIWESYVVAAVDGLTRNIEVITGGEPKQKEIVHRVHQAVSSCFDKLHKQEEKLLPSPSQDLNETVVQSLLFKRLEALEQKLQEAKGVLESQDPQLKFIEPVPVQKDTSSTSQLFPNKVTDETIWESGRDALFGVPLYQLGSDLLFTTSWCGRKIINFLRRSLSSSPLKIIGAFLPCTLATLGVCVVSIPCVVVKKIFYDWPRAIAGIFKPAIWIKIVVDEKGQQKLQTRREESSDWLHHWWLKLDQWADNWIQWVKARLD